MLPLLTQIALVVFGLYHLVAGSFVLGPHHWVQNFGKRVYRLDIPTVVEAKYFLCLKSLGLMALMVACLSFLTAFWGAPLGQSLALIFFGLLFLGRALLRYLCRERFVEAYRLDFHRSLKNIIFNTILACATFALAWMNHARL